MKKIKRGKIKLEKNKKINYNIQVNPVRVPVVILVFYFMNKKFDFNSYINFMYTKIII